MPLRGPSFVAIVSFGSPAGRRGAGDQGLMYGFATDETPALMPLPILLAYPLTRTLAEHRTSGRVEWLPPDAKAQLSVLCDGNAPVAVSDLLLSTQPAAAIERLDLLRPSYRQTTNPGHFRRPGQPWEA